MHNDSHLNEGRIPLGTKDDPLPIDDDEPVDNHDAISEDEGTEVEQESVATTAEEDKFFFGSVFEKVEDFDQHLNDQNPWHPHLARPLFPAQVIGFRWMASRHAKGGGLIGDKVGCGKVLSHRRQLNLIADLSSSEFHSLAQEKPSSQPPYQPS
jgi:SNF2 family DNA or RNA helicase